jgi:hydroxymethylpyrimidine/phosphomethylpyrimidine kinase
MTIARVLIIAGSDSGGGAGIQADIRTVTMLGGHPTTAITAITAQNTLGVQAVHPIPVDIVVAQMRSVIDDLGVDAIKIGMIGSADIAHAVADMLETMPPCPLVFDPVMIASSGAVLADEATIAGFTRLMRLATLVTPNLPELAALGGEVAILAHGAALLAKGGHGTDSRIEDRLIADDGETVWTHDRLDTRHHHGTGCTLASGIATGLAQGMSLSDACDRAIGYVQSALKAAPGIGAGHGPMGHALAATPYYHLLAASDPDGWDAAAFAARWR